FRARFETTAGTFVIEVRRDWAPRGADRFYTLVKSGYYDGVRFFRVISGFMAQFGIHGDPKVSTVWRERTIPDDPVRQSNARGMVTYATAGPGTRTTQIFINYRDNSGLDGQGSAPPSRTASRPRRRCRSRSWWDFDHSESAPPRVSRASRLLNFLGSFGDIVELRRCCLAACIRALKRWLGQRRASLKTRIAPSRPFRARNNDARVRVQFSPFRTDAKTPDG